MIIFFTMTSWIKSGNLLNPVSIFNLWWGFFIIVSTMELDVLRVPTFKAYKLFTLSMAMFSLGSLTFLSGEKNQIEKINVEEKQAIPLKLRLFYYSQILMTFFLLFYLYKAVGMLKSMDPGSFRSLVFDDSGVLGNRRVYFFYIILPILHTSTFTSFAGVFYNRIKKRYMFLSVFNLLLYSMIEVGRTQIFIGLMGFSLGVIYIIHIKKFRIKFTHVIVAFIPILFLVLMSAFRKSFTAGSKSVFMIVFEYFVWYFTGAFTAFDYFLDFCKEGISRDYSYIRAVFAGIDDYLLPITRRIFDNFRTINNDIHDFSKIYRSLGGVAGRHNSHFTMLMAFMWDAGYYGIIIFPYIFGAIISKVFNSFRKKHSISTLAILLLLTYLSLIGIMRWELRYVWSWGTLAGIFFISQKFVIRSSTIKKPLIPEKNV